MGLLCCTHGGGQPYAQDVAQRLLPIATSGIAAVNIVDISSFCDDRIPIWRLPVIGYLFRNAKPAPSRRLSRFERLQRGGCDRAGINRTARAFEENPYPR